MKVKLRIHKDGAALYEGIHDVCDAASFGRAWADVWTQLRERRLARRVVSGPCSKSSTTNCSTNCTVRISAFRKHEASRSKRQQAIAQQRRGSRAMAFTDSSGELAACHDLRASAGEPTLDQKVKFLSHPAARKSGDRVMRLKTHMSWAFLAGDRAYKLKKPTLSLSRLLEHGPARARVPRRAPPELPARLRRLPSRWYRSSRRGAGWRSADANVFTAGRPRANLRHRRK